MLRHSTDNKLAYTVGHQPYLGHRSIVPTVRYRRWRLIDSGFWND
jgi:hypothetical protein